ncbi:hypothetical protein [Sulfuricurvum sp.]|uniref:hypothetical protein n=1 Tax=Sulfuricurvum sp. TaxID=2025608 RepID=UPI003BB6F4C4
MKVLLLAGGFGTRLSEETDVRQKPMVARVGTTDNLNYYVMDAKMKNLEWSKS